MPHSKMLNHAHPCHTCHVWPRQGAVPHCLLAAGSSPAFAHALALVALPEPSTQLTACMIGLSDPAARLWPRQPDLLAKTSTWITSIRYIMLMLCSESASATTTCCKQASHCMKHHICLAGATYRLSKFLWVWVLMQVQHSTSPERLATPPPQVTLQLPQGPASQCACVQATPLHSLDS